MPKVTVIVPNYNNETYLQECLDSLLKQTLDDMEIIVIDDASTDYSVNILKSYKEKIKVIYNQQNSGLSNTRNLGIANATGDYIGFVDSDDFVHPEMYEDLYYAAKIKNYPEIVSTGICQISSDKHRDSIVKDLPRKNGKVYHIPTNPNYLYWESPSCCNKIFRRDTLNGQSFLANRIWEDIAFTYSQIIKADYIISYPNPDYYYRRHENSGIMASCYQVNPHLLDIFDIVEQLEITAKKVNRFEQFSAQIKTLQTIFCLERIAEVATWNIPLENKILIANYLDDLTYEYYGNWREKNQYILRSKIDMSILDTLGLTNKNTLGTDDINRTKQNIQKQLTLFK